MRKPIVLFLLLLLVDFSYFGYAEKDTANNTDVVDITESLIVDFGSVDISKQMNSFLAVSPDNSHLAWCCKAKESPYAVFLDGKLICSCDEATNFTFSPDSTRYSFSMRVDDQVFQYIDSNKFGPFKGIMAESITFSPNSQQVASIALLDDDSVCILKDGRQLENFSSIREFSFSPDSKHFAYIASDSQQEFLILDGKTNKKYQYFQNFKFSPKGKGYAVLAEKKGKLFPIINGRKGETCLGMTSEFVFSPNGKTVVFVAQTEKGAVLFSNGKATDFSKTRDPIFSPDGKTLVQILSKKDGEAILFGGSQIKGHDRVTSMKFSPKGKRFVFTATMTHMEVLIENGKFNAEYHDVIEPVFTSDEKHLFFCAKRDLTIYLVRDGSVFAQLNGDYAYSLAVSNDGKNSAFVNFEEKKAFLVVNGARVREIKQLLPQRLGYTTSRYSLRGAKEALSMNVCPFYGTPNFRIQFDSNSTFHMIAGHGNALYRISGKIK